MKLWVSSPLTASKCKAWVVKQLNIPPQSLAHLSVMTIAASKSIPVELNLGLKASVFGVADHSLLVWCSLSFCLLTGDVLVQLVL